MNFKFGDNQYRSHTHNAVEQSFLLLNLAIFCKLTNLPSFPVTTVQDKELPLLVLKACRSSLELLYALPHDSSLLYSVFAWGMYVL